MASSRRRRWRRRAGQLKAISLAPTALRCLERFSYLVHHARSPAAAASPASDFSLPTTLPFFLPLAVAVVFSPSPWESLTTGRRWGLAVSLPVVLLPLVPPPRCFFAASPAKLRFSKLRSTSQARRMTSRRHFKHCLACGVSLAWALLCRRGAPKGLEGNFKWGGFEIIFEV